MVINWRQNKLIGPGAVPAPPPLKIMGAKQDRRERKRLPLLGIVPPLSG